MLVEVASQYGVGVMYAIERALSVLDFGYGSFLLLVGILTAVAMVVVFAVIVIGSRSILWAFAGSVVAAVAGPIATLDYTEWYPSTGFVRFGPSWLLVLALSFTYRSGERRTRPFIISCALLGISSIWAFEAAFYSFGTFALVVVILSVANRRLSEALETLSFGVLSIIGAAVALGFFTAIGSGQFPDPREYLDFIRLYSSQGFGTLPVADWSLGYLIAGTYVASFVGIGVAIIRYPNSRVSAAPTIVPLVGTTTLGFLAFTYFLGRSHPNNLTHISPPFIAMMTLWTWLAASQWFRDRRPVYLAAVGTVFFSASVLVMGQWEGKVVAKFPDSALGAVLSPITGYQSLPDRISLLRSNPRVSPRTEDIETLVLRNVPADQPLLILAEPSLLTESLMRLDRVNVIPLSVPDQDGLLPSRRDELIRNARSMPCGTRIVAQTSMVSRANSPQQYLLSQIFKSVQSTKNLVPVGGSGEFKLYEARC